jgi:hypothetical protein
MIVPGSSFRCGFVIESRVSSNEVESEDGRLFPDFINGLG